MFLLWLGSDPTVFGDWLVLKIGAEESGESVSLSGSSSFENTVGLCANSFTK